MSICLQRHAAQRSRECVLCVCVSFIMRDGVAQQANWNHRAYTIRSTHFTTCDKLPIGARGRRFTTCIFIFILNHHRRSSAVDFAENTRI